MQTESCLKGIALAALSSWSDTLEGQTQRRPPRDASTQEDKPGLEQG